MAQNLAVTPEALSDHVMRLVSARLSALRSIARELGLAPSVIEAPRAPAIVTRRRMGIVQALEWAFGAEHAQLDFDGDLMPDGFGAATSTVWLIMQRGNLGCRIDGGGRSRPATDAEIIAAAVASLPIEHGGRAMAVQIAELARAGRVPDCMPDAEPRVVPAGWKTNNFGRWAKTEVVDSVQYRHRGRLVTRDVLCCPVRIVPTADQIAAARRNYLNWYGAMVHLQWRLGGALERVDLTDALPPLTPWRKGC